MIQYYVSFLQMQNKNIVIFMRGAGTYYCNGVLFHFNVENVFDTQVNCVRGFVTEQTILPTSQSTTVLLKMSIGYLDLFAFWLGDITCHDLGATLESSRMVG